MIDHRYVIHVTHADCVFTYADNTKRVHPTWKCKCTHAASKAVGLTYDAPDNMSEHKAFMLMTRSELFRGWAYREAARVAEQLAAVEQRVRDAMLPPNLRCEVRTADDNSWRTQAFIHVHTDDATIVADTPRVIVCADGIAAPIVTARTRTR